MRRLLIPAALAAAAIVPSGAYAGFTHGVSSAEVTASSALLWGHSTKAGKVKLFVAVDRRFTRKRIVKNVFAKKANDLTVQSRVAGLAANKRYYYFFAQGRKRSVIGTFKTAPKASASKTIRFAYTGDTDGTRDRQTGKLFWNRDGSKDFGVYRRMAAERNDFNVNLGDTMYSDPDVAGVPVALSLKAKRSRYREVLSYPNLVKMRVSGSVYNQWDDHEFVDDFDPVSTVCHSQVLEGGTPYACNPKAIYRAGAAAFREYMPVTYSSSAGTYRTFRWGRNLEMFILDERSFRSQKSSKIKVDPNDPSPSATKVCDNPPGTVDPAPQVPQRIRGLFGLIYEPFNNPPPPACLAAINDPNRTMLGAAQYAAFTNAIKRSTATWKIVINETPIQQHYLYPYDNWQGYNAERDRLVRYLRDNVKNVVFLTTDWHTNMVNDVRLATFPEEGGPVDSGIMEYMAGGVADLTWGRELNEFTDNQNAAGLAREFFYKKLPPDGPGMQCAELDTFSYGQVEVSATRFKLALKDAAGREVKETGDNGRVCGPYVLTAK